MIVLGIDPGATGGFAGVHKLDDGRLEIVNAMMAPIRQVNKKPMLDVIALDAWMHDINAKVGVIEQVNAMPKQGVASSFQFGRMFGAAEVAMQVWCERYFYVTPQVWKKKMGLSSDKVRSLDMATSIFGQEAADRFWPLKKHEGVAEAALLAAWWIKENA